MEKKEEIIKPFEVRQDELVQKIASECKASGLPAGALALILEKVLANLRQEAYRIVIGYHEQVKEQENSDASKAQ